MPRMNLLIAIILMSCGCIAYAQSEPPVGFVCHYPFIDVGMDELPKSGASALITRAVMGEIEKEEGKFDFSSVDKQITYAEKHGLQIVLLLECNPVYCPPWLREKVKAAGQMQEFQDGADCTDPSINSTVFAEKRDEFIRKVVEYVKERDTKRVITHYNPGAEWWFVHPARYNPLDVARFRDWLEDRYYSIETLNEAWHSDYESFEEVPAPKFDLADFGRRDGLSRILSTDIRAQDCSWSTRQGFAPKVTPGKTYLFSARVKATNVMGRGAHLSTSWLPKGSNIPFHMNYSDGVEGTTGWRKIQMRIAAPMNADRVWLLLKLAGFGTADFDDPDFREEGSPENLLANPSLEEGDDSPDKWFFDNWIQGEGIKGEYLKSGGIGGSPFVRISIPRPDTVTRTYGNQDAAAHDWSLFWYEVGAQYINDFACVVKSADDSRPTATYLTYAFAFPVEWDYVFANAIAVDEVAMRGDCIHTIGMQIPSADGDPFRVTANLDLVRKYGKPMWAVDLLDWTRGVAIGYEANNKVAQATVQHGATGIFHYCWHGTPDYDFYPVMKTDEMHRMLTDAREAIKLMRGMRVRPRVALIQPILPASPEDNLGCKNDYRSFYGWYKLLEAMHHTFDVVTLRELQKGVVDLRQYDWVLVPDCAYMPWTAYLRLVKFAGWGGKLVLSGRFAERDEIGKPLKADKAFLDDRSLSLPDYGRPYAGRMHRNTWAGNTPPLFIWRSDTPATRKALNSAKSDLGQFFSECDIESAVLLEPDDPNIRCVEWEGRGARAFYLVTMGKKAVQGAKLRIRSGSPSELHIYADVKQVEGDWKLSGEWVEVALPDFDASCIVIMDM